MRPQPDHVRKRVAQRHTRLVTLGFDSYEDYLRSAVWRAVRARYLAAGDHACICGERERLELHHLTYIRVGGQERDEDITPLCSACHRIVHVLERRGDIELNLDGLYDEERAGHRQALKRSIALARTGKLNALREQPLHDRLARLLKVAPALGVDLRRDLHVIGRMLDQAERKNAGASAAAISRIDRHLRNAEDKAVDRRASVPDDLAA